MLILQKSDLIHRFINSVTRSLGLRPRVSSVRTGRPARYRPRLEALEERLAPAAFADPNPQIGDNFGASSVTLSNGYKVITAPAYDTVIGTTTMTDAGAVYLFNATGVCIYSWFGSHNNDQVGSGGVTAVGNNVNYLVISPSWTNGQGAVTWATGAPPASSAGGSALVGATNSLVGSTNGDQVGSGGVTAVGNGNYLVRSPFWSSSRGAVTWGAGTFGVKGAVSATNSLVGSTAGDSVGNYGVTVLTNANYVVASPFWSSFRGAVTWGAGASGVKGAVGATNSLVGSNPSDQVGYGNPTGNNGVTPLTNGNYLVTSSNWKNGTLAGAGAMTWCKGTSSIIGPITTVSTNFNSTIGQTSNTHLQAPIVNNATNSFQAYFQNEGGGTYVTGSQITGFPPNSAPTAMSLSSSTVNENQGSGTTVGTFTTTDPGGTGTLAYVPPPGAGNLHHTYHLVNGVGSTHNGNFHIVGDELKTARPFDFETQVSHSIRVRTTDRGGKGYDRVFIITVNNLDDTSPTVTVTIHATTLTNSAPSAPVTFEFSEAVLDFNATDVTVVNGTLTDFTQVRANRFTAVFTANYDFVGTGSVGVGTGYTDVVGNQGTAGDATVKIKRPGVLPDGQVGSTYPPQDLGPESSGFQVTSGKLPRGLVLAGNGTLSGTPTTAGVYTFTVQANQGGPFTYQLTIAKKARK